MVRAGAGASTAIHSPSPDDGMLPNSMTTPANDRRQMRLLAVVLTALWAVTAIAIATAYRPGGPIDVLVALACFVPVAIADVGVVRPAKRLTRRHRTALVWVWLGAVVFVLPVIYGVASTVTPDGPQRLLPSPEAAYAGALALYLMSFFSVVGLVHHRLGARPLQRRASLVSAGLAAVLTVVAGTAFLFVALANERESRDEVSRAELSLRAHRPRASCRRSVTTPSRWGTTRS